MIMFYSFTWHPCLKFYFALRDYKWFFLFNYILNNRIKLKNICKLTKTLQRIKNFYSNLQKVHDIINIINFITSFIQPLFCITFHKKHRHKKVICCKAMDRNFWKKSRSDKHMSDLENQNYEQIFAKRWYKLKVYGKNNLAVGCYIPGFADVERVHVTVLNYILPKSSDTLIFIQRVTQHHAKRGSSFWQ